VALRGIAALAHHEWAQSCATRLKSQWRSNLVDTLGVPARDGTQAHADVVLAVEQAADGPELERLATSAATSLVGLAVLWWAGGWLPLVITLALLGAAVPLYVRAGRRSETLARDVEQRRALLETRQLDVLQHAPELRALGAVDYGANEIGAISTSEHRLALRAIRVALESSLVTEFLSGVSIGLVAMVVGFHLLDGRISLVRALVAVLVTTELFSHVRRYGVAFHRRDDAARALGLLGASRRDVAGTSSTILLETRSLVTSVHDQPLTLRVAPGERLVVRGPSGVGKTTLLYTLLGWRPARAGSVARTDAAIGFVSAESTLLSGTLRENLTLGANFDDGLVTATLRSLGLVGARFRDLDVELLADGRGLSGGERVRLLLARALLAGPALLVVDDVAGVLDEESRENVRTALAGLHPLAVVEATSGASLLSDVDVIELRP